MIYVHREQLPSGQALVAENDSLPNSPQVSFKIPCLVRKKSSATDLVTGKSLEKVCKFVLFGIYVRAISVIFRQPLSLRS